MTDPVILELAPENRRELAKLARSLKDAAKLPLPRARALLRQRMDEALDKFSNETDVETFVGARGCDVLCTAGEAQGIIDAAALRLFLKTNKPLRNQIIAEIDAVLATWRENLAALAAAHEQSENVQAEETAEESPEEMPDDGSEAQADQVTA